MKRLWYNSESKEYFLTSLYDTNYYPGFQYMDLFDSGILLNSVKSLQNIGFVEIQPNTALNMLKGEVN